MVEESLPASSFCRSDRSLRKSHMLRLLRQGPKIRGFLVVEAGNRYPLKGKDIRPDDFPLEQVHRELEELIEQGRVEKRPSLNPSEPVVGLSLKEMANDARKREVDHEKR